MKKITRVLSAVIAAASVLSASITALPVYAANISFTDVSGHWAWTGGQIPYLVDKGVLNGYKNSNGTYYFKPDGEVTRAEFLKMLDETFGLTKTTSINYSDVKSDDWYYTYYAKAAAQGFILDYGDKGSPNQKITRQEATALLVRYLDLPANETASSESIADYSSISGYYNQYVLRAVYAGIINGYNENGKTYFKPEKTLTRAEALTILYRAAGCIYNTSVYTRDSSSSDTNNTVTKTGITINKITMDGRNIVTEGANDGIITFAGCDINGTLVVRGGGDVTFDNCTVDEVVMLGGGKISAVSGTEIETVILETTTEVSALSNTAIKTLEVKNGANSSSVKGNGTVNAMYINADGFTSTIVPETFEIGNNLTAALGGKSYSGSSDSQNPFSLDPFVTSDDSYYYINTIPAESGRLYYYYTNNATTPAANAFDSYYNSATYAKSVDVTAGTALSEQTYPASTVSGFSYVVLQLVDGSRRFPVTLIENKAAADDTGFSTAPYLSDSVTIKALAKVPGTIMWFYAENGNRLNQLTFMEAYNKQSAALKGDVNANGVQTSTIGLKSSYLENYDYVAVMLKTSTGVYYTPVLIPMGDNGFEEEPKVKTAGVITFKPEVSGDIYCYYSKTSDLPTADRFKTEFNAADHTYRNEITKGKEDEIKYESKYIGDYPWMIIAIRDNDSNYMQPVVVDINITTGFKEEPTATGDSRLKFKTEDYGTVYYYYTSEKTAPTVEEFNEEYTDAASRYKGRVDCSLTYEYIEYSSSYASTYPYMAIMFENEDGKEFCPVLVELDRIADTGFYTTPYVSDGKVYFSTVDDGEVFFYFSRDDSNVDPDDFYGNWYDEPSSRRSSVEVNRRTTTSFKIDENINLKTYPYIIMAFLEEDDEGDYDEFYYPYVLDIEKSSQDYEGAGIKVSEPNSKDKVEVEALKDGILYYYWTDDESDTTTSSSKFQTRYANATRRDHESMEEDDTIYIDMHGYDYLVLCFKLYENDEYQTPVVVNAYDGIINGDDTFDDDHDVNSDGLKKVETTDWNRTTMMFTINAVSQYDGRIDLIKVINGTPSIAASKSCIKGEDTEFSISAFDVLGSTFYLQLVDTSGDKYKAYKLELKINFD